MDAPPSSPGSDPLAGRRIVVVDDYPDSLDLMSQACAVFGARALTAASAREALALVHAERPDAVLTDIGLRGGEDGVWLLGEVRRLDESIPVIALTGRSPEDALAAGFDGVLLKPADPWQVCDELRRVLVARPRGR